MNPSVPTPVVTLAFDDHAMLKAVLVPRWAGTDEEIRLLRLALVGQLLAFAMPKVPATQLERVGAS